MQFIAILRGINVSGKNLIKMTELKKMMEDLSFNNVQTYIQSGNIVFESKKKDSTKLEDLIAESIEDTFSLKVPVIVLSKERLASIIAMNPYKDYPDQSKIFYTFLKKD